MHACACLYLPVCVYLCLHLNLASQGQTGIVRGDETGWKPLHIKLDRLEADFMFAPKPQTLNLQHVTSLHDRTLDLSHSIACSRNQSCSGCAAAGRRQLDATLSIPPWTAIRFLHRYKLACTKCRLRPRLACCRKQEVKTMMSVKKAQTGSAVAWKL